jgi:prephenate dehydratase
MGLEPEQGKGVTMPRISIQGARGSFHDIVARKKFPGDSEIIESDTFHQVFEDIRDGKADYGVVAIENSIYGSFRENYDLMLAHDAKIVGEVYLRIVLDLIAMPGVKMEDIGEVYTHPLAMTQSHAFLEKHPNMVRIESDDTAGSVRMIKEEGRYDAAAIASGLAAEIYGMKILAKDVETKKENYTRFLLIAREIMYSEKADKTSLVIRADDLPGSLYACLKCFADEGINLSKIESRPALGRTWDYHFYLDFNRGLKELETERALGKLKKVTTMLKVLGTYESGRVIEEG